MNCSECERLFDAYLDGQLAGSLRLEFDAHRLRCRRCQQTLAMLESVGHVITSDSQVPELPDDFTERVLHSLQPAPVRVRRFPSLRVATVVGALLSAAAVLTIALWQGTLTADVEPPAPPVALVDDVRATDDAGRAAITTLIAEGVEDRLWEMHAVGRDLTSDVMGLARYLDVTVPEDVVRTSDKLAGFSPLGLLPAAPTSEEPEPEPVTSSEDVHSI